MKHEEEWKFLIADSFEKVFSDVQPRQMNPVIGYSVFLGETASFQVAFKAPSHFEGDLRFTIAGREKSFASFSEVKEVPVALTYLAAHDEHYLRTEPGDFPDLLEPLEQPRVSVRAGQWQSVWVDLVVSKIKDAGVHPVSLSVSAAETGLVLFEETVVIDVLPRSLPGLGIVDCHWLHTDCISDYYQIPVFSETYWLYTERFIASLVEMQGNSVLTPVWTPPLDTAVGSYRTPVQLMDVRRDSGRYSFEFSKLLRWMDICEKTGIKYLEISHLFSQWGATCTPAIYGTVDGEFQRIFGWETSAAEPSYREFLSVMLPELLAVLEENWGLDRVFFHISDEPSKDHASSYRVARETAKEYLPGCSLIDALSDLELWEDGLVPIPVVANDHIEPFLEKQVDPMWTYYCVGQHSGVSNRFISMPLARTRVIGHQIFKYGIDGFLHWGFNFYNTELSARHVDPFEDTSAGGKFPGGDSFIVYPGPDGNPYPSLRYRAFAQAMWDIRAMQRLADLDGNSAVTSIIDPDGTLKFNDFSYDPDHYRQVRETLNRAIMRS